MSLKIPGYRVLIKPDPTEEVSDGGIHIVYADKKLEDAKREYGEVLSIGS